MSSNIFIPKKKPRRPMPPKAPQTGEDMASISSQSESAETVDPATGSATEPRELEKDEKDELLRLKERTKHDYDIIVDKDNTIGTLEETIKSLRKKNAELEATSHRDKNSRIDAQRHFSAKDAEIKKLKDSGIDLWKKNSELRQKQETQEKANVELYEQVQAKEKEIQLEKEKNNEFTESLATLKATNLSLNGEVDAAKEANDELQKRTDDIHALLEDKFRDEVGEGHAPEVYIKHLRDQDFQKLEKQRSHTSLTAPSISSKTREQPRQVSLGDQLKDTDYQSEDEESSIVAGNDADNKASSSFTITPIQSVETVPSAPPSSPAPSIKVEPQTPKPPELDFAPIQSVDIEPQAPKSPKLGFAPIQSIDTIPVSPEPPKLGFAPIQSIETVPIAPREAKLEFAPIQSIETVPIAPAAPKLGFAPIQSIIDIKPSPVPTVAKEVRDAATQATIASTTSTTAKKQEPTIIDIWNMLPLWLKLTFIMLITLFTWAYGSALHERNLWLSANDLSYQRLAMGTETAWFAPIFLRLEQWIGVENTLLG